MFFEHFSGKIPRTKSLHWTGLQEVFLNKYLFFVCVVQESFVENIQGKIHNIRGFQVMLDSDLAQLYGVSTKRLNEQVKRNIERFPEDFMFQLTESEELILRSQFATSSFNRFGFDTVRMQAGLNSFTICVIFVLIKFKYKLILFIIK